MTVSSWIQKNCRFAFQDDGFLDDEDQERLPLLPASENFQRISNEEEAGRMADWYGEAMRRGWDKNTPENMKYVYPHLKNYLLGGAVVWRPTGFSSALVGEVFGDTLVVSHFAPDAKNRFAGLALLKKAAKSTDKIIFSVTGKLADMLAQVGFHNVAELSQPFGGNMINKKVMANDAVLRDPKDLFWMAKDRGIELADAKECSVCGNMMIGGGTTPVCSKCRGEFIDTQEHNQRLPLPEHVS